MSSSSSVVEYRVPPTNMWPHHVKGWRHERELKHHCMILQNQKPNELPHSTTTSLSLSFVCTYPRHVCREGGRFLDSFEDDSESPGLVGPATFVHFEFGSRHCRKAPQTQTLMMMMMMMTPLYYCYEVKYFVRVVN